jgi:predicted transcriptional regulator
MTEEKIKILKELQAGNKSQVTLHKKFEIEWFRFSGILEWLKSSSLVTQADSFPRNWQITQKGLNEVEKWEKGGTQGELFKVKK